MNPKLNALRADLVKTAHAAREVQAAKLYELEAVRAAMVKAATGGFDTVTIPGPVGLDLCETAAALAARTWLTGEGIGHRWDTRTGAASADAAPSYDLVLTWHRAPTGG